MGIEIVGTGHILKRSVAEVRESISKELPDYVAVELDIKRFKALEGASFSPEAYRPVSIREIIPTLWRGGSFPVFLQAALAMIQRELGEKYGTRPGADMCAAILSARAVGSRVLLIDRDIEVTLNRLMSVPLRELFTVLASNREEDLQVISGILQGNIEDILKQENLDVLIGMLRNKHPYIYNALIDERDRYMAHALYKTQEKHPESRILAVVGAGHKKGVAEYLEKMRCGQEIEITPLLETKQVSVPRYVMLALLVSAAFILMKSEFLFTKKRR